MSSFVQSVVAQEVDEKQIETEIKDLEKQINELTKKRDELISKLIKKEVEDLVIETKNSKYTFSEVYVKKEEGLAIIPFKYENKSGEDKKLWTQ